MVIFNSYVKLPEGIIPDSVQDSVATADLTAAAPDKASMNWAPGIHPKLLQFLP